MSGEDSNPAAKEKDQEKEIERNSKLIQSYIGPILSVIALSVSAYSLYDNQRARSYAVSLSSLNSEYSTYKVMAQLQHDNPLLSYLFSPTPQDYASVRAQVKKALSAQAAEEEVKLRLQERALVNYIYTGYEEVFYNWIAASNSSDKAQANLLKRNLDYFTSFLCNSRLLWYWGSGNYHFDNQLGADTVKYYDDTVKKDCHVALDETGPYQNASE